MVEGPAAWACIVVLCHNRPDYLARTLSSLEASLVNARHLPTVLISQDGDDAGVAAVGDAWSSRVRERLGLNVDAVVQPRVGVGALPSGYHYIARHMATAIDEAISVRGHPRAIVIEDDLELASDAVDYFHRAAETLDADPTLLAVCGCNEVGQDGLVGDPHRVLRTDCFSSLGWMIDAARWAQLRPTWPEAYWDDWLREPAQRLGRSVLCPETSRVRTFGRVGVSAGQFFDDHLAHVRLSDVAVDWDLIDVDRWTMPRYRDELMVEIDQAEALGSVGALFAAGRSDDDTAAMAAYTPDGMEGTARDSFAFAAHLFGFMNDPRHGLVRGAFDGVLTFVHRGRRKYLVPRSS